MNHFTSIALSVLMVSAATIGAASAAPGGVHGPPPSHGNPNGAPPIGMPATQGDTDRGLSEGKGHNDIHGAHVIGRVTGLNGNVVTVSTNGNIRTFTLTPAQIAEIRTGEHLVIFTNGGTAVSRVEPADVSLRGVVTGFALSPASHKTMVTVRLPNGKLRTITVANEAAENMQLRKGEPVVVTTNTAFFTPASIQVSAHPHQP